MPRDPRHRANRAFWNRTADAYQASHGEGLEREAVAWGVWRIPEAEVGALPPPAGRDVLEFGCGGAQWTAALAAQGARAVGIDLASRQLAHARGRLARLGVRAGLVNADGSALPFRDASFDVVFCDHGVMSWARPEPSVAEAARVLRPGGTFSFCMATPWLEVCWDAERDEVTRRLQRDYFDLYASEDAGGFCFQLPYGAWIRLFRAHDLVVEDLVELRPPAAARTTYADFVAPEWARRWPAEHVWRLRKPEALRGATR